MKFWEAVKFPIWSGPVRRPWNLGVVTDIVPRGLLDDGNFALLSQSTASRVVRYFWYLKAVTVNLVRRGPIPGCSHVLGVLGVTCE